MVPVELVGQAGGVAPDFGVVEQALDRDEFFGLLVDRLQALGALREDLRPGRAVDIVRVVDTLEAYADLTGRRGWSDEEWKSWMTETLAGQLLGPTVRP